LPPAPSPNDNFVFRLEVVRAEERRTKSAEGEGSQPLVGWTQVMHHVAVQLSHRHREEIRGAGGGGLVEPAGILFTQDAATVPEPGSVLLFSAGLAIVLMRRQPRVGAPRAGTVMAASARWRAPRRPVKHR
jgi:hypothetical protein